MPYCRFDDFLQERKKLTHSHEVDVHLRFFSLGKLFTNVIASYSELYRHLRGFTNQNTTKYAASVVYFVLPEGALSWIAKKKNLSPFPVIRKKNMDKFAFPQDAF